MNRKKIGYIEPDENGAYRINLGPNGWFVLTREELFAVFHTATQQVSGLTTAYREWRNDRTPTE